MCLKRCIFLLIRTNTKKYVLWVPELVIHYIVDCLRYCEAKRGPLAGYTRMYSATWSNTWSPRLSHRLCSRGVQFWIRPHSNSWYCCYWDFSDAKQYSLSEAVAFSEMRKKFIIKLCAHSKWFHFQGRQCSVINL